jgi:hypothetical protein
LKALQPYSVSPTRIGVICQLLPGSIGIFCPPISPGPGSRMSPLRYTQACSSACTLSRVIWSAAE